MIAIGLFDILEFELSDSPGISLVCDDPALPVDDSNLVVKAAKALTCRLANPPGVSIRLLKRIPSGAGLGGGSSDAATTLIALNQLLNAQCSNTRLAEIASFIGSDVPFFISGPSSVCQGRGDRVVPLPLAPFFYALLILSPIHLPTPIVYAKFDELKLGRDTLVPPDYATWSKLSAARLLPLLSNDLEPAAFALKPQLATLKNDLQQTLSQKVLMSGSGSSLFTLCDNLRQAEIFSVQITEKYGIKTVVAPVANAV